MFRYTPKKAILREMETPKTGRWWDTAYRKHQEIIAQFGIKENYMLIVVLRKYYPKVEFYSKTLVREVPVNGYLFPVAMFNEEKIV